VKLLFINRYFYPDLSATAQLLSELAEDLDACGDTVTVITGRATYVGEHAPLPTRERYKGIEIRRVRSSFFGRRHRLGRLIDYLSFYAAALLAALWLRQQDCLIVLSDPPMLSVLALVVRTCKRLKTVCWLQDVFPEIAIRAGVLPEGRFAHLLQRLALWSLRHMDRLVVLGRCMEQHLLARGIPAHKMVRIPNWADGKQSLPVERQENPFLAEHGLLNRLVVMYSGNLGVVHEFETIQAVIRKLQSARQFCFCFIGEGHQKERLVEEARRERWENVVFLPYQAKETLQFSLAAGDVHLVTLRPDMTGLSVPSKLYGILGAGRPVIFIGSEESEVAAVIREAHCGYVLKPGDVQGTIQALRAYSRDPAQMERHGRAARVYFHRYCDRPIAVEKFRRLLQRVTADD
jgi:colanic acid biosynthesis glycosyl transferase WcaI